MRIPPQRQGFALAVAMVAIVVIGALVAGAIWTSNQEFRSGRNALVQERALAAAEYGQNWVLANWNNNWSKLNPGDTIPTQSLVPDAKSTARVRMTRLNLYTYAVVSEGEAGAAAGGQARRRTSSILRLDVPNLKITGAITSAGSVVTTGNMAGVGGVVGNDITPTGWSECPPNGPSKPAISNDNPSTEVTSAGTCGSTPSTSSCLISTAGRVSQDASAGDPNTYDAFGDHSWATMTAMADANHTITAIGLSSTAPAPIMDQVFPTVDGGGACNTAQTRIATTSSITYGSNWGEPLRSGSSTVPACRDYYPVIWIKGLSTSWSRLAGATTRGQGILLVEGNLHMAGTFQFYGLIIVKGSIVVAGGSTSGPKIVGAVLSGGTGNSFAGATSIQYSSCAVANALNSQTPKPVMAPDRGWANMY